jgi:ABC-2 type transport system permease protein
VTGMETIAIMVRVIRQITGDKRTLGLILVVPMLMMTLIWLLLGETGYVPTLAVADLPSALASHLVEDGGVVATTMTVDEAKERVASGDSDAALWLADGKLHLLFASSDPGKDALVVKTLQSAMKALVPAGMPGVLTAPEPEYLYGTSSDSAFDNLGYVLLGVLAFFFVFILSGIAFVRERTGATLERLLASPVRRSQVVAGYTAGFGVFAMIQCTIMVVFAVTVLGMHTNGSLALTVLVMVLLGLSATAIGAFASIFAENEFQIMQFIPVFIVPQFFFSGMISLDTIPLGLGVLSRIMPVYYACDALRVVLVKGGGFVEILPQVAMLLGFVLLFSMINVLALKKHRRL